MGTRKVLFVDDHKETRRLVDYLLSGNFEVSIVSDGKKAMDLVTDGEEPFDLLVIDIQLGANIDGVELLQKIRGLPDYADVPALACTAMAMPGDQEWLLEEGFDAYVSKPFSRAELMDRVHETLRVAE